MVKAVVDGKRTTKANPVPPIKLNIAHQGIAGCPKLNTRSTGSAGRIKLTIKGQPVKQKPVVDGKR